MRKTEQAALNFFFKSMCCCSRIVYSSYFERDRKNKQKRQQTVLGGGGWSGTQPTPTRPQSNYLSHFIWFIMPASCHASQHPILKSDITLPTRRHRGITVTWRLFHVNVLETAAERWHVLLAIATPPPFFPFSVALGAWSIMDDFNWHGISSWSRVLACWCTVSACGLGPPLHLVIHF